MVRGLRDISLLNGLYKVEYGVNDAFGRSIMCMHNGKLMGGSSAFAHLGTYREKAEEILGGADLGLGALPPHEEPSRGGDGHAERNPGKIAAETFGQQRCQQARDRQHTDQERAAIYGAPISAGS